LVGHSAAGVNFGRIGNENADKHLLVSVGVQPLQFGPQETETRVVGELLENKRMIIEE